MEKGPIQASPKYVALATVASRCLYSSLLSHTVGTTVAVTEKLLPSNDTVHGEQYHSEKYLFMFDFRPRGDGSSDVETFTEPSTPMQYMYSGYSSTCTCTWYDTSTWYQVSGTRILSEYKYQGHPEKLPKDFRKCRCRTN